MKSLGIDVGSTTVKAVLIDESGEILYKRYERHNARVRELIGLILEDVIKGVGPVEVHAAVTGSAGLGAAERAKLPFVQEVVASSTAVEKFLPGTDAVVELGGEDAKIIFFGQVTEQRMNGTCAGGTGAFIDQIVTLMDITADELNELASRAEKLYPIASRCGVFAKTDVQPLLNQGARREDVAASILQAVVNQTIAGLAQGRKIEGNVAFLGGPLAFLPELGKLFVKTLKLTPEQARFPKDGQYFVALGCAVEARRFEPLRLDDVASRLDKAEEIAPSGRLTPLFANKEEYDEFTERHAQAAVATANPATYEGDAWLGIDAGSTTTKLVLITDDARILYSYYAPNRGDPVEVLREQLLEVRRLLGSKIKLRGSAVTGYGEELMCAAYGVDDGIVETVAHYTAARFFEPQVDYIIDIGGQDMKCFRVHAGAIDSIMLNEACSSGCGSFIETFAKAIGHTTPEFAKLGLFGEHPADLGSRCTVFMNSSVKQAQKEGATVADISAGLSISVVKNALYKVIRVADPAEIGEHVVVQGGTFLNDAILRAFERELGREVTRPAIAGLMGAFGCALHAREVGRAESGLIGLDELEHFEHTSSAARCGLCGNNCTLTVNKFTGGRRFITGNRCERGAGGKKSAEEIPNVYAYKLERLQNIKPIDNPTRGEIGIPFVLNFFDTLPFWSEFFAKIGVKVVLSGTSDRNIYSLGQDTIPSDTVCYPAKLVHGHIQALVDKGCKRIFYPCAPYNNVEYDKADNYYNCPVVAYYPELIAANMPVTKTIEYINPYLVYTRRGFEKKAFEAFKPYYPDLTLGEVKAAVKAAREADEQFRNDIRVQGERAIAWARARGKRIIVLSGRPYHIDPEINHGIDRLITSLGLAVVTEEAVAAQGNAAPLHVLNQWSYHARLYNAAEYVSRTSDMEFVQLVSFGCGIDAITGDELRSILESKGKFYTQVKIDEITNLGAAKIRLRSLVAAMEARDRASGKAVSARG